MTYEQILNILNSDWTESEQILNITENSEQILNILNMDWTESE